MILKKRKYYHRPIIELIFVSLNLRRPLNLINSNSNIETLFYAIEVIERKKNRKIHQQSKVIMLTALYDCESDLYRQMSGVKSQKIKNIIQIGSGSLGSKINLHLARNGTQGFSIIDNKYLTPHNNARHALFGNNFIQKSKFQANVLNNIGIKAKSYKADIRDKASIINNNSLIIDSTASISVRNFLTNKDIKGSIIHTALYDNSKLAFLLVESNDRNPRIDDLMCCIYNACLFDKELAYSFFSKQNILSSIGQGCGSYTTICPDSRISLCASGMASKIQKYISNGIVEKGEINIGVVAEDDMSINWRYIHCKKVHILQARNEDEFDVRIFETVSSKMKDISEEYSPKEYGGVLIGNISLINRTMTVTDILEAPEDSKFSKTLFEIGKRGLRKKVKDVEKKTNGLLTYLGTWHSHPFGGEASKIDKDTKVKILILRDYEPTVCLIWTPNRIIRV